VFLSTCIRTENQKEAVKNPPQNKENKNEEEESIVDLSELDMNDESALKQFEKKLNSPIDLDKDVDLNDTISKQLPSIQIIKLSNFILFPNLKLQ
jgi:hypothetical protein